MAGSMTDHKTLRRRHFTPSPVAQGCRSRDGVLVFASDFDRGFIE
jgi:hypothetical protein